MSGGSTGCGPAQQKRAMADPRKKTRLSSPLMFAFRDAHRARDARVHVGQKNVAGQEALPSRKSMRAAINEIQLREELTRDLDLLMNTINLASIIDLDEAPQVRDSIVNFGLTDIGNRTIDENRVADIVDEIRTAIVRFEPRLIEKTIDVARDPTADAGVLQIRFNVSGEMACDPVAVPVEFIADLEVTSGKLAIRKR